MKNIRTKKFFIALIVQQRELIIYTLKNMHLFGKIITHVN
jgi:hypothetical protein